MSADCERSGLPSSGMTTKVPELTLLSLNLDWTASAAARSRQCGAVNEACRELGGEPALLALQETKPASVRRFVDGGWEVLAATKARPKGKLGVAVLGRGGVVAASEPIHLDPEWFLHGAVYPELAAWFAERAVAVDVRVGDQVLRFASLHATPGSSRGPGKRGVGGSRKPWFHRRIADWMATWARPYAFAIDANSPDTESLDSVKFFAESRCEAGEGDLLALRTAEGGGPRHAADDLLRVWLRSERGAEQLRKVTEQQVGPLWISHYTRGGKPKRFDHIWATSEIEPVDVRYWSPQLPALDEAVSDHAIVGVRARLDSP